MTGKDEEKSGKEKDYFTRIKADKGGLKEKEEPRINTD